ncbi:MAG: DoxX family protein [Flavobacteriales bacterium]|nr:DoxX family protein [Flavobacteriales bacterium]
MGTPRLRRLGSEQALPALTCKNTFGTKPNTMEYLVTVCQLVGACSVAYVWIFRYPNVVAEFQHFGLSDEVRNAVGAAKTALATMLVVGIWYPPVVPLRLRVWPRSCSSSGLPFQSGQPLHQEAAIPDPFTPLRVHCDGDLALARE